MVRRLASRAGKSGTVGTMLRWTLPLSLVILACGAPRDAPDERLSRERAFEESMRNVVLVGYFTVFDRADGENESGAEGPATPLRKERYAINRVVHRTGDLWTFHARIQFGGRDVTLPVPVNLVWADDTPVVSVTELGLPGLGTYTARVAFYRDAYAGMWWGGEHGGNMFGRIERSEQ